MTLWRSISKTAAQLLCRSAGYPRLTHATAAERANFRISGAGHGIHWPDLDEDIGVKGMLLGKKSAESHESFARWLALRTQE
jgi:hypothetical protein